VSHLTPDEIETLVMHGDAPSDASRRHLAACPACARRVEREARLELAIYDGAAGLGDERATPAWRYAWAGAAILVLGIAGWLIELRREAPTPPSVIHAAWNPRTAAALTPPPLDARFPPDTPCLRDPRAFMPGFDVRPPEPPGSRVTTPALRP
jgi:hypothetical protein